MGRRPGWGRRAKGKLRRDDSLCVRIDSAGDCAEVMHTLHGEQVFYVIKGRITPDLYGAVNVVTLPTDGSDVVPPQSLDMVVTFRNIHNWMARDCAGQVFATLTDRLGRKYARRR